MTYIFRIAAVVAALFFLNAPCFAVDAATVIEAKRTTLGLYLTSEEVPPFLVERRGHDIFVDVRMPEELAATGVATLVDANVPLLTLSADAKPQPNPDFVAGVSSRLAAKGLGKDDVVVLICQTGRRSARAANLLAASGFSHVYSVVDGFSGDGAGGWKNNGLPWRQS